MRASLLMSLGLSPLGCGGTAINTPDGSAGSAAQGGATAGGSSYPTAGSYPSGETAGSYPTGETGGAYPAGGSGDSYPIAGAGGSYPGGYGGSYGGSVAQGGTGGYVAPHCDSPVFDPVTHLTTCANGLVHRPAAVSCPLNNANGGSAGVQGQSGATGCTTNADCAALTFGYCQHHPPQVTECRTGCQQDSDCATGELCECDGSTPAGKCVIAACQIDADCGANSLCAPVTEPCSDNRFMCTTSLDQCTIDADCRAQGGFASCSTFASDHRTCSNAVCGRPFLVSDCARVADVEARADWLNARITPGVTGLSPLQRAELSAHWARLGQMEHASIAAFARFNLQLLSLGAPAELIEACNQALADETAHTRLCFALASQYGGTSLGPARLDIQHCFEETSLEGITKLVLREGCLGETVAALEALEAAATASDPAVRAALLRIAQDEQAHAELAFKFLAWALTQSSPEARAQLEHEAQRALADFEAAALARPTDQRRDSLASDGIIGAEALRAIHLGAVREVVEPLLSAVLRQSANANRSAQTQA